MILKIQRPLGTIPVTDAPPMALVYNRNRHVNMLVPWHMIAEFFQPDELKIYVKGKINRKNQLLIDEIVPAENF